jgi:hypothetical protein
MMFGRELNLSVDLLLGRLSGNDSNSGMISDYANNLSDKLEKIQFSLTKADNIVSNVELNFSIMPSDCGLEGVVLVLCIPKITHISLNTFDNGNKYIMVVGDYLTKWMEAIPIPDAAAKTVADKFVERIVSIIGQHQ